MLEHTTHSRFARVMEGGGFVYVEMELSLEQMRGSCVQLLFEVV